MKKGVVIFLTLLLSSPAAFAHRLNEYLEATTINLSRTKVFLEFRLTPGMDVAEAVLKEIDLNGDKHISKLEERSYLATLNRDLSLMLDGRYARLNVIASSFPIITDMKKGVGDIIVKYDADIEQSGSSHQLKLKNTHYSAIAVYLVNCLLPVDTCIRVVNQQRSADQSIYQLNFTTGNVQSVSLSNQQPLLEKENRQAVLKTYFVHGIWHILKGYDHLLFLCALVLGAAGLWDLIKIVTAFTIAHSITLALAAYGLVHLPALAVEPVIAASIVFVAIQNMVWPQKAGSYTRLAIAFFFGLFHGLGFAGGLLELMHAMPINLVIYAIVGFSLGIEAGNQLVLLPLYGGFQLLKLLPKKAQKPQRWQTFQQYASGAIAVVGMYYLFIDLSACF